MTNHKGHEAHKGTIEGRALTFVLMACVSLLLLSVAPVGAQEGHPLKGSWIGTWSPNKNHGNDVVIVLSWDGKNISGTINPGTDNMAIKNASLNPDGWLVHLEADAKDKAGNPLTYVLDGKIENLPLANRSISGTWKNQKEGGVLKISRQ